jgi:nitroimidazol reductase NimA-like FMN-containing flavoprotein (pyridoxamine 5'-phosphate oxidase superfamily)
VRRRAGRGAYDRALIDAILDAGLVGHAAVVSHGQPFVLPLVYARHGDRLLLHGSPLSRLLSGLADGVSMSFAVTLVDGLVLARSAFHHSVNYRSVVVLGSARAISDPAAKREALQAIVERVARGRSADVRGPSDAELEATEVVTLPLNEASAKVRAGPPVDAPEDYALPVWAGVLPLALAAGEPVTDPRCELPIPPYVHAYHRGEHDQSVAA